MAPSDSQNAKAVSAPTAAAAAASIGADGADGEGTVEAVRRNESGFSASPLQQLPSHWKRNNRWNWKANGSERSIREVLITFPISRDRHVTVVFRSDVTLCCQDSEDFLR